MRKLMIGRHLFHRASYCAVEKELGEMCSNGMRMTRIPSHQQADVASVVERKIPSMLVNIYEARGPKGCSKLEHALKDSHSHVAYAHVFRALRKQGRGQEGLLLVGWGMNVIPIRLKDGRVAFLELWFPASFPSWHSFVFERDRLLDTLSIPVLRAPCRVFIPENRNSSA